ncbi:DNA primase catalytic subunit [Coprinopsis marcescibilis]|uniref:DNA primase n=1 Tax=Coprinopsis marcescibilis TaxID=230819 RepID=A0A5C3KZ22_COPMA|nr:DNA primase catalytic subunit [Coprinopsis marcescibilis]
MANQIDSSAPEAMLMFYRKLYPFKSIYNWLNHDQMPTKLFTHREFAFTLQGDVYLRYKSFNSAEDLKKDICHLNPTRFEIGPVYSARPRDKKTIRPGGLTPLLRELVFDIDMTDYDPVRTCCSEANICKRCWAFISAAVKVLDHSIRDHFGYEKLLWVYSGRRGIHLWISDKEAMELTDQQRKAIVGWMNVVSIGSKEASKRLNIRTASKVLPPPIQDALVQLVSTFTDLILEDQDCFASESGYETLLEFIPNATVVSNLRNAWEKDPERSSEDKWEDLKQQVKQVDRNSPQRVQLKQAMEDIILHYTYPRIDAEVSKHRNHLLKAPFCIHPKTGRVCVPVDPSKIDEFDPEKVPTVSQLLTELDEFIPVDGEEKPSDEDLVERTSLRPYVQMLDQHAAGLMTVKRETKQDPDAALTW